MEPTSDAGVVPLYSILGELADLLKPDEAASKDCNQCLEQLGEVLDQGGLPSIEVIDSLRQFHKRLEYFVRYYDTGEVIEWEKLQGFWGDEEAEPASRSQSAVEFPSTTDDMAESAPGGASGNLDGIGSDIPEDQLMKVDLDGMRDVLEEFYQEAGEHLGQIEAALLEIESDYGATEPIRTMFRSFHTIKGVAGFLDLVPVRSLAHEIETLLDLIRSDKMQFTESTVNLVLESRDQLQTLVEQVATSLADNQQPSEVVPVRDLILRAQRAIAGEEAVIQKEAPSAAEDESRVENVSDASDSGAPVDNPYPKASISGVQQPMEAEAITEASPEGKGPADVSKSGSKKASASIRMNTEKLDSIIEAVGELVIVESQLADSIEAGSNNGNSRIENNMRQLKRITRELQMSSMSLRMVSLKPLFQRMQRLARDVANKSGKKVHFRVEGEDTEMDRTVVEQIGEALVHMIRNSIDHGIELPADRLAMGKSEEGNVLLRASYVGQNIVLELEDDGAGIISEKVLAKAKNRGLVAEGKEYTRDEILQMIFLPGFSTVDKVSDFSGRGVGMDVVRSNVQQLRGRVDLASTEGEGSKLTIALPLTMAIIDGLLVSCGGQRYVVPVSSISMTLKPEPKQVFEVQSRGQVIKHRGAIFKLIFMADLFGIESEVKDASNGIVIMIETAACDYALVVDEILHKQEVVIKQIGTSLSNSDGISGGAILGDGTVALILDPAAMSDMGKVNKSEIPAELATA